MTCELKYLGVSVQNLEVMKYRKTQAHNKRKINYVQSNILITNRPTCVTSARPIWALFLKTRKYPSNSCCVQNERRSFWITIISYTHTA